MWKYKLGGAALIGVALFTYNKYDRSHNYIQVRVRAERVEQLCYGKQTESGVLTKTTRTTREVDCPELRELVQNHPDFKGFTVYENTYVSFRYISPVDKREHRARIIETRNLQGKPIHARDVFDALVSKLDANKAIPL